MIRTLQNSNCYINGGSMGQGLPEFFSGKSIQTEPKFYRPDQKKIMDSKLGQIEFG